MVNKSVSTSPAPQTDGNLALGSLIRLIESVPPSVDPVPEMAFSELKAWFHERFSLQEKTCSGKAIGDALAFATRLGLIPLNKVERTRQKITTYIGIDAPSLDAAFNRWRRSNEQGGVEAVPDHSPDEDGSMEPPWDVHLVRDPYEALRWAEIESFDLDFLDSQATVEASEFDF